MNRRMTLILTLLLLSPVLSYLPGCGKTSNPAAPISSSAPSPPPPSYHFSYSFSTGSLLYPQGLAIAGQEIWIDEGYLTQSDLHLFGLGGNNLSTITNYASTSINQATQIYTGPDSFIYVADSDNNQVAIFSPEGDYVSAFGKTELGTDIPAGVVANTTYAYVSDLNAAKVIRYTIGGSGAAKTFSSSATFGNSGPASLSAAAGLALDSSGRVFVADYVHPRILTYDANGVFQSAISISSTPLAGPAALAIDSGNYLYASNGGFTDIRMYNPSGSLVTHIGTGILGYSGFVAFDDQGNLFVTDETNRQVVVFQKNGAEAPPGPVFLAATNTPTITATPTDSFTPTVTNTPGPNADLAIYVACSDTYPSAGSDVVFTLTAVNGGPNSTSPVVVSGPVISFYTFNNLSVSSSLGSYSIVDGNLTWNIPSLDPGESGTFSFDETTCVGCAPRTDVFSVSITSPLDDLYQANNNASISVTVH